MRKSNIKVNNKDYRVNGYRVETENVIPTELADLSDSNRVDNLENAAESIEEKIPDAPSTDGTYTLKCVVSNNGATKTYQWVLDI